MSNEIDKEGKMSEDELLNVVKQVFMGWLEVDEKFEVAMEQIVALIKNRVNNRRKNVSQ